MERDRRRPDTERIHRDIVRISEFIRPGEPGFTRLSFSQEDRRAREYLAGLMENEAGLTVRIDAAGNLVGTRKGKKEKPFLLMGSHVDTVRGGGRFDGVAGVVAGLEVARLFEEEGFDNVHPMQVVVFLAEEPSPFKLSTIGSRAMAGKLWEEHLLLRDDQGRDLRRALAEMGGNPDRLPEARRSPEEIRAYLELHIEQGPLLFTRKVSVGIVKGIVGITRARIEVNGRNDHAGTTPMAIRKDALAAGSEMVLALERLCGGRQDVVGTIGKMDITPNALNVIPGMAILGADVRSLDEDLIKGVFSSLRKEMEGIGAQRGLQIRMETEVVSRPVLFEEGMVDRIRRVCSRLGLPCLEMISGAGHDASHLAQIAPAGMIFIPSRDGRSHCPEEWSEFEDICLGTEVLANTMMDLDKEEMN